MRSLAVVTPGRQLGGRAVHAGSAEDRAIDRNIVISCRRIRRDLVVPRPWYDSCAGSAAECAVDWLEVFLAMDPWRPGVQIRAGDSSAVRAQSSKSVLVTVVLYEISKYV